MNAVPLRNRLNILYNGVLHLPVWPHAVLVPFRTDLRFPCIDLNRFALLSVRRGLDRILVESHIDYEVEHVGEARVGGSTAVARCGDDVPSEPPWLLEVLLTEESIGCANDLAYRLVRYHGHLLVATGDLSLVAVVTRDDFGVLLGAAEDAEYVLGESVHEAFSKYRKFVTEVGETLRSPAALLRAAEKYPHGYELGASVRIFDGSSSIEDN
ncbi:hypothetical protein [Calidithermus terrae]|uniref:hypothetical protein n=1 Tax=Calidithermus terrae TaxID=1408545 RepID=UPI0011C3DBAB|nr:hypothetical protein [Calidithermus terrae]